MHQIMLFISAHCMLPDLAKAYHIQVIKSMDVLLIEWNDHGDHDYLSFLENLHVPLHKVVVNIPDFNEIIDEVGRTGSTKRFDPYEKEKARLFMNYVLEHRAQKIGLVCGEGPWKFVQQLFMRYCIPFTYVLYAPL